MKNAIVFLFMIATASCMGQATDDTATEQPTDNEELKALYKADQGDRKGEIDWSKVSERDSLRRVRVYELLDANQVKTSNDYANAAMIFQHGLDTVASGMAVKLMRRAVELDSTRNKWLLAAAIDRDLMRRGKPQVYGTQYRRMSEDEPWVLYEVDTTAVTDEERLAYNVPTLAQTRERLKLMNKKQLVDAWEAGTSVDEIIAIAKKGNPEESDYNFAEPYVNLFGYSLMAMGKDEEALKIFKLNIELYPDAYNTYDSYGECLVKLGRIEEGKKAYRKSLELNPENKNAIKVLEELEK
jgi:tetratricopeptide (TPR) repeat protein